MKKPMHDGGRILFLTEQKFKPIITRLHPGVAKLGSARGSGALTHLSTVFPANRRNPLKH